MFLSRNWSLRGIKMGLISRNMSANVNGLPKGWTIDMWKSFKKSVLDVGFNEKELDVNADRELALIDKYGVNYMKERLDRRVLGE
jgi:hypothetical protein